MQIIVFSVQSLLVHKTVLVLVLILKFSTMKNQCLFLFAQITIC